MRKPLFLIVDSDNSWVFQNVPQLFGQPLVVLMSPQDVPSQYQGIHPPVCVCVCDSSANWLVIAWLVVDLHPKGGLLTLFLHSPLTAVCVLGNIKEVPYHLWETGQAFVDRFLAEASRLMTRAKGLGNWHRLCIHSFQLSVNLAGRRTGSIPEWQSYRGIG